MCCACRAPHSLRFVSDPFNPIEDAVERALEAFVYAPIGLVFDGPDPFPELVEKGRNQITAARMLGEFAVRLGQGEACKLIEQVIGSDARSEPTKPPTEARRRPTQPSSDQRADRRVDDAAEGTEQVTPRQSATRPDLAIPGYDGLSASQVVTRLGGLSPDELEAVRRHEAAHRGRKTILNKVAQIRHTRE